MSPLSGCCGGAVRPVPGVTVGFEIGFSNRMRMSSAHLRNFRCARRTIAVAPRRGAAGAVGEFAAFFATNLPGGISMDGYTKTDAHNEQEADRGARLHSSVVTLQVQARSEEHTSELQSRE